MKIESFAALRAVLQSGTFAAASSRLNITPSAVSMQMKQLEGFFGQPLFDRSGAHPQPTPLAWRVVRMMEGPLDDLESLRKGTSLKIEGMLGLGIIEMIQPVVLPAAIRWLREHYPKVGLRLARGRSASLTAAVKAGRLDAAVVAQPPRGGGLGLNWSPLLQRELVLILPPDSTETSLRAVFGRYEWIRYDRNTISGSMAARFVNKHVDDVRGQLELASPSGIMALVSAGLGVSVMLIGDPKILQCYPVRIIRLGPKAPTLQLALVTRKIDTDNRLLQVLYQALRGAAQLQVAADLDE